MLKVYQLLFVHCAPKGRGEGMKCLFVADDSKQEEILRRIDEGYNYDGWKYKNKDMEEEGRKVKIYDDKYDVIGEETFLERMLRLRGEYHDDDAEVPDGAHYGPSFYGWDEGRVISKEFAESLIKLGLAEDWR